MGAKVVIKVRVMAATSFVEAVARDLTAALEGRGYEVVEVSALYVCRAPQEDQSRVYVTLLKREGE
jgi:hypothetical protein